MAEPVPPAGTPTPPIAIAGGAAAAVSHLGARPVALPDGFADRLAGVCASVTTDAEQLSEASRDWWPLAMIWATEGQVAARAAAVAQPGSAEEVAAVLRLCNEARVPVTTAGGRSGVCGASVPAFGGVMLDTTALSGIVDVDDTSLVLDVRAGTFGEPLEAELRAHHGVTIGHWPQSIALATVGGWLACRGAGQYSTRYGKIEDLVVGLDVVLADGTVVRTGDQPAQASGPDLTAVFVGSEGTLGVITSARLKLHPVPATERRAAYAVDRFEDGIDACRRILRRGATPAVLRLHDQTEAMRYGVDSAIVLVLDEGDEGLVGATMAVVAEELAGARALGGEPVDAWFEHRNDVAALEKLIGRGWVVDTMEVAGRWSILPAIHRRATEALQGLDGTVVASCHLSHSYVDGACLYFTFAAQVDPEQRDAYYRHAWDAATGAVLAEGGALSHHHGVGLNRSRFMPQALGSGLGVLESIKTALDPAGILNPGKLGLASPFGPVGWGPEGQATAGEAP